MYNKCQFFPLSDYQILISSVGLNVSQKSYHSYKSYQILICAVNVHEIKKKIFVSTSTEFFRTNFNAHFNMNMYVTLSSTCFGP